VAGAGVTSIRQDGQEEQFVLRVTDATLADTLRAALREEAGAATHGPGTGPDPGPPQLRFPDGAPPYCALWAGRQACRAVPSRVAKPPDVPCRVILCRAGCATSCPAVPCLTILCHAVPCQGSGSQVCPALVGHPQRSGR
jgi:hypothetical protein